MVTILRLCKCGGAVGFVVVFSCGSSYVFGFDDFELFIIIGSFCVAKKVFNWCERKSKRPKCSLVKYHLVKKFSNAINKIFDFFNISAITLFINIPANCFFSMFSKILIYIFSLDSVHFCKEFLKLCM